MGNHPKSSKTQQKPPTFPPRTRNFRPVTGVGAVAFQVVPASEPWKRGDVAEKLDSQIGGI